MALVSLPSWAASEDPYAAMLNRLDWPEGRSLLSWGGNDDKVHNLWKAVDSTTYKDIEPVPSADRSRIIQRQFSAPVAIAPEALAGLSSTSKALLSDTGWYQYWVRSLVQPINGASTQRMFSTAERRIVNCERALMVNAAQLYFASLDTSGTPYLTDFSYLQPVRYSGLVIAKRPTLAAEYRAVCGPILQAAHSEDSLESLLASRLPFAPKKAASDQPSEAIAAASAASVAASGAAVADPVMGAASAPAIPAPVMQAASAAVASSEVSADPQPLGSAKARIRLFAQNGTAAGVSNEAACSAPDSGSQSAAGFFKNVASALHMASNESLGMPETVTTRRLSDRSGIISKAYYVERSITAEMPATVDFTFSANNQTCPSIAVSFVPQAGADYESKLDVGYGYCLVTVGRITPSGDVTPVEVVSAPRCPKSK